MAQETNYVDIAGSQIFESVYFAYKNDYMFTHGITNENNLTSNELAFIAESAKLGSAFSLTYLKEYGSATGVLTEAQLKDIELYKNVNGNVFNVFAEYLKGKDYLDNPDGTFNAVNFARIVGSVILSGGVDALAGRYTKALPGIAGVVVTTKANEVIGDAYKKIVGPIYIAEFSADKKEIKLTTPEDLSTMLDRHYEKVLFIGEGLKEYATWSIIQNKNGGESDTLEYKNGVYKFYNHTWDEFNQRANYFKSPLATLLGYLGTSNIKVADSAGLGKNIIFNAFSEDADLSASSIRSDGAKFYAVNKLVPFVFQDDVLPLSEVNNYSENYLKDRADFLEKLIDGPGLYEPTKYQDTELNITTALGTSPSSSTAISVLFTDRNVMASDSRLAYRIYGKDSGQTIKVSEAYDLNDYIEGGLGSDVIYGGGGDDTIYTNANIASQYDKETSSTVNKVYAGDGDDTVYGSNGIDVIYADSDNASNPEQYSETDTVEGRGGSDVIYGGGDDDYLYADRKTSHSDTSGDYIVGGRGGDTIDGNDGNDTIYGQNATDEHNNATGHEELHGGAGTIQVNNLFVPNIHIKLKAVS